MFCELQNITKCYGNNTVLKDINLCINAGEMIAITGQSGSGKSTLLNIIGLLETYDSGNFMLWGKTAPKINSRQTNLILRNKLAYLFQNFALIDNENVKYNLDIALEYVNKNRNKKLQMKIDALKMVALDETYLSKKIYQLSGGEQQRVAIARVILKPCELILADEPTGSLDAENRDAVIDILKQLNRNGKTIIIVTHDKIVAESCDRVIELR